MNRRDFLQSGAALGAAALSLRERKLCADIPNPTALMIHTVLGEVPAERLGMALMHEHAITVDWSELYETIAAPFAQHRSRMVEAATRQIQAFHDCLPPLDGPGAIVDCTPIRVGRYPDLLVALARATPVHIVACTGFWCEAMAPQHPWMLKFMQEPHTVERLAELYIREIRSGMEDPASNWGETFTEVKAGIIKAATSTHMRPSERRCHEASAMASVETGAPITTHTTDGGGLEQAELFLARGVAPAKIIIGHQGNLDDRLTEEAGESHLRLASLGCYVQFDRVGHAKYPVEKVARQITQLVKAGHTERVLVGHDLVPYVYSKFAEGDKPEEGWQAHEADLTTIPLRLAMELLEQGNTPQDVHTILVENPKRALAF